MAMPSNKAKISCRMFIWKALISTACRTDSVMVLISAASGGARNSNKERSLQPAIPNTSVAASPDRPGITGIICRKWSGGSTPALNTLAVAGSQEMKQQILRKPGMWRRRLCNICCEPDLVRIYKSYRRLPIFWALNHFKESQSRGAQEGAWKMELVNESATPVAAKASVH